MGTVRRALSHLGVAAGFTAGGPAVGWLTDGTWQALGNGRASFSELLTFGGAVVLWVCYAWLGLSFLLIVASTVPGAVGRVSGLLAERVSPVVCRRIARAALGISLVASPVVGTAPAHAAPTGTSSPAYTLSVDRPRAGPELPTVDRPMASVPAEAGTPEVTVSHLEPKDQPPAKDLVLQASPRAIDPSGPSDPVTRPVTRGADQKGMDTYVVKRGDTLWGIARDRLPAGASDADIGYEWRRWYAANRDTIGDNPDLILPGQIFHAPSKDNRTAIGGGPPA